MSFKKKEAEPQTTADRSAPYWDEPTVDTLAEFDCFDVQVTDVCKRTGYGKEGSGGLDADTWKICGILTHPKLIAVEISFIEQRVLPQDAFGDWYHNGLRYRTPRRRAGPLSEGKSMFEEEQLRPNMRGTFALPMA
jgi:hypothetical protein